MHHFEDPLFKAIFNQLKEPRLIVKADAPFFTIVCTNPAWQQISLKDTSSFPGKKFVDVSVHLISDQSIRQVVQDMLMQGITRKETVTSGAFAVTDESSAAASCWYKVECNPVTNSPAGKIAYLICTLIDVTSQVENKQLLMISRQHEAKLLREQQVLNRELTAANEELSAINEELVQSQKDLAQINQELERRVDERTRKLAESENRFRTLFEQSPVGMCILSGKELIVELVNEPMLQFWGRSQEDVVGYPHAAARPELKGQPIHGWLQEVYESGETRINNALHVKFFTSAGMRDAYVNSIYHPLKDEQGKVTGLMIILNEITDWILARQQAEGVQEQLQLALESAELGTWYIDVDSREMVASRRLKELFCYEAGQELSLQQCLDRIDQEYKDTVVRAMEDTISKGGRYEIEYPISTGAENQQRWVRATGKRFSSHNGKPAHFSGTVLDITGRKMEEIRKNDFIAIASHELKTPLTSLKAYLQVMSLKAMQLDEPFFAGAINRSLKQIDRMYTLISGFLDITRLESGKLQLNKENFDIQEVIREIRDEAALLSPDHEFQITPCAHTIDADREKIVQVLTNLLSNAAKYSAKGTRIMLECQDTGAEIIISVKDEGIGIDQRDTERLFDRYYRVESRQTKTISGFGIGLYLCSQIIRLHSGRIWVESEVGKGSTFFIALPR